MFLTRLELKRRGWLFAFMWMFSSVVLFTGKNDSLSVFIIVLGFIYPILTIYKYWNFANSNENKIIYNERQHEIFPDRIITNMGEISESTIAVQNFIKVLELKDLYLLYLSKGQTLFLPKRIFETTEDENWFRNNVFLKIKNR
ncbi:YcxB family protein [Flavobacterium reichenbachii]|nr:YcxB family protein [Flavobacterium reichenbachii]